MDDRRSGRTGSLPTGALAAAAGGAESGGVTRRSFLTSAGLSFVAATLAACGGAGDSIGPMGMTGTGNLPGGGSPTASLPPGVTVTGSLVTVSLAAQAALGASGGFLVINSGAVHAMVINLGANTFRAFTSVCTHEGCNNSWGFSGIRFLCNCHGSEFDTNGAVTIGPATMPLLSYPTTFDAAANAVTIMTP